MKIFNSLEEIKNIESTIIALGNFDGVHLGHQKLIREAVDYAHKSGLKSAVLNYLNSAAMKEEEISKEDVAASFQRTVIEVLVEKTREAVKLTGLETVTLAGGVSANRALQDALAKMCEEEGWKFYKPSSLLYTDNAAMIGCRAYYLAQQGKASPLTLNAKPGLSIGEEVYDLFR